MSRASESARTPLSRRAFACASLFAGAGLLALSGCGSQDTNTTEAGGANETQDAPASSQDAPAQADKLVMGITVDPDGLDPHRTAAAATFQVTNSVYDPLLKVTTSGELVPGLAESWETSEDGLVATFKLREGLVFSNGNACDADAVVASFLRLQDDAAPRKSEYAGYTFEAVDERTVQVTSSELNVAMLTDFAYAWSAVVDTTVADTLANQPVGTGPYKVVSWTPQQSVVLEANPSYWGEAPHIANVELRVLPEATTQASSLRAHDVDLILAANEQVAAFEGDTAFQIMQYPMNGVQLMAMNCANEVLADVRVRRAINMAVDKDALIEAVWWGYGKKIGSHFPPSFTGYVDCNDTYAYDPDAAKALLEECGYSAEELTFSMRLPKSYKEYVNAGRSSPTPWARSASPATSRSSSGPRGSTRCTPAACTTSPSWVTPVASTPSRCWPAMVRRARRTTSITPATWWTASSPTIAASLTRRSVPRTCAKSRSSSPKTCPRCTSSLR